MLDEIFCANSLIVGYSKISAYVILKFDFKSSICKLTADKESPPKSKKLSSGPISDTGSNLLNTSATCFSIALLEDTDIVS